MAGDSATPGAAAGRGAARARQSRLAPEERARRIVEEAVRFFAEVGFAGQTRELAQRIGVTQPLLYRYFPTKQDLIDRVYDEVYLGRWDDAWSALLADRARPLRARLIAFYRDYTAKVFTYEWMRIYMFAALRGADINKRYTELVEARLLRLVCEEFRHHRGLPDGAARPLSDLELEMAWGMHAGIFYYFVRKHIYETAVADDVDAVIAQWVDAMLDGAPATLGAR